jgi:multicomponent Na+:H+ antiporter subunit B
MNANTDTNAGRNTAGDRPRLVRTDGGVTAPGSAEATSATGSTTDSPVVLTTVRLLSPFVLTFALFTLFHGTSSVGGGFQGGVVAAAVVVTLAFAFGIRDVTRWLDSGPLLALVAAGPVAFGLVALAGIATGGAFLQFDTLPIPKASVYATEVIELGIGATVAAVIVALFAGLGAPPAAPGRTDGADVDPSVPAGQSGGGTGDAGAGAGRGTTPGGDRR